VVQGEDEDMVVLRGFYQIDAESGLRWIHRARAQGGDLGVLVFGRLPAQIMEGPWQRAWVGKALDRGSIGHINRQAQGLMAGIKRGKDGAQAGLIKLNQSLSCA